MKQFDVIAEIEIDMRLDVTCKKGETYKEAALNRIKEMSPEACKELVLSSIPYYFHVEATANEIIYLMVDDIVTKNVIDVAFIDDIEQRIDKNMTVKEVAKIFAEEVYNNTEILLEDEVAMNYARKILRLLHKL